MATIVREFTLDAPADQVWTAVADVGAVDRLIDYLGEVTLDGATRTCQLADAGALEELIVTVATRTADWRTRSAAHRSASTTTTPRCRSPRPRTAAPRSPGSPTCPRTPWPAPSSNRLTPRWTRSGAGSADRPTPADLPQGEPS